MGRTFKKLYKSTELNQKSLKKYLEKFANAMERTSEGTLEKKISICTFKDSTYYAILGTSSDHRSFEKYCVLF